MAWREPVRGPPGGRCDPMGASVQSGSLGLSVSVTRRVVYLRGGLTRAYRGVPVTTLASFPIGHPYIYPLLGEALKLPTVDDGCENTFLLIQLCSTSHFSPW